MSKKNNVLWITIRGLDKKEILESFGFKVSDDNTIISKGESFKVDEIKAIVGGEDNSLKLLTDVSDIEDELEYEEGSD